MEDDIARRYDNTSMHYDKRYREIQFDKYGVALSFFDIVDGDILDVGCGTGLLGDFLEKRIKGIDISSGMLEMAKGRIDYIQGDARNLPYEDSSFDFVFSFTVLQNIRGYEKALKEIRRVMRKRGKCVITFLNKPQYSQIGDSINKYFHIDHSFAYGEDVFFICSLPDFFNGSKKCTI